MKKVLHVYSQQHEHDDLIIAGDRSGLEILRDTLGDVIEGGVYYLEDSAFTTDGEGFNIIVLRTDDPSDLPLPFSELPQDSPEMKLFMDMIAAKRKGHNNGRR